MSGEFLTSHLDWMARTRAEAIESFQGKKNLYDPETSPGKVSPIKSADDSTSDDTSSPEAFGLFPGDPGYDTFSADFPLSDKPVKDYENADWEMGERS